MKKILIAGLGVAGSSLLYLLVKEKYYNELEIHACDLRREPWKHIVCGELIPDPEIFRNKLPRTLIDYIKKSHELIMENTRIIRDFSRMIIKVLDMDITISARFYMIDKSTLIKNLLRSSLGFLNSALGYSAIRFSIRNDRMVSVHFRDARGTVFRDEFNLVIACDSYPSVFYTEKTWSFIKKSNYLSLICFSTRAYVREPINEPLIVVDPRMCPGGYAWIFPRTSDVANIGLGIRLEYLQHINKFLNLFTENFKMKIMHDVSSKNLPVDGFIPSEPSILYLGDAGGFVVPTNGAGINPAIMSSMIAVETDLQSSKFNRRASEVFGKFSIELSHYRKLIDPLLVNYDTLYRTSMKIRNNSVMSSIFNKILSNLMLGHLGILEKVFIRFISTMASFKFLRI